MGIYRNLRGDVFKGVTDQHSGAEYAPTEYGGHGLKYLLEYGFIEAIPIVKFEVELPVEAACEYADYWDVDSTFNHTAEQVIAEAIRSALND